VTRPDEQDAGATVSPWLGSAPEIVIAVVLTAATALAGYLLAGWDGLTAVAVGAAALAMILLRALLPQLTPDSARKAREKPTARSLSGYSHRRFVVKTSMDSVGFYNHELRPLLEHLLAARLAERHGVNLYAYPSAARALLCRSARDADLWEWIDPANRPEPAARAPGPDRRGIPPRTLARLLDRLEKL
jgi:hypothetical protein